MLSPDLTSDIARHRHAERLAAAERHHLLLRRPLRARVFSWQARH